MKKLISAIRETDAFKKLVERLKESGDIWLSNLWGSAFSCVIDGLQKAAISEMQGNPCHYIIVVPEEEIEEIQEDLIALESRKVLVFSHRESLEGEELDSCSEVFSQRVSTLVELLETQAKACGYGYAHKCASPQRQPPIIITSPQALSEKLPSPELFKKQLRKIKLGDRIEREEFVRYLINCGYTRCAQVTLKGDFSVRGGIIDIYIPVSTYPVRIELLGDEISSIREFDPESQISTNQINETVVMPAKEFFDDSADSTLFDYLACREPDESGSQAKACGYQTQAKACGYSVFIREPIPGPRRGTDTTRLGGYPDGYARKCVSPREQSPTIVHCSPSTVDTFHNPIDFSTQPLHIIPSIDVSHRENRISTLIEEIKKLQHLKFDIILLAEYEGQSERIAELLKEYDLYATSITVLNLAHGWIDFHNHLGVIVLKEIFAISKVRRRSGTGWTKSAAGAPVTAEGLVLGDYVVHINYGIGIFRGVRIIPVEENLQDFFLIEYADGDKLYIPLDQVSKIQKYTGRMDPPPPLNHLGTAQWQGMRKRVKKSIEEYAKELLNLYAWRKSVKGHIFSPDTHWQQEFELGFSYEETPDQLRTTLEVKEDMEKPAPMDRLLCGDVGYGKTEVAMRAAFKSVMDGKQVAVLVPTTILADQHFQTFTERMAPFPIRIEVLSRFKSKMEQRKIIEELGEGRIEIVIGTHRLIQNDVHFPDLGLLIVDEEQRFGVLQKEYFKKLRKEVDVLSLSATPIPRTLYMSTSGIRDISIINTPPLERLAIKTFVMEFNPEVIRTAILREMERKGQVFYVHNRIEVLQIHAHNLKNLIPDARIAIAHGRTEEKTLENIMIKFLNKEFDVLVSTDIVGAGLDIANVNTIIITDAQDFGLSQLYQLRGRVGRAGHQAYAYIFYNPELMLTEQSRKRLRAISEFVQLGSGLRLALKDLEIRGAGNVLGKEQHGYIQNVGLELYCRMLEEAISELKGEPVKEESEPMLDLKTNAYIPDEYIASMEQKTVLYKRMVTIKEIGEIKKLKDELKDRYGEIPQPVLNLMEVIEIRVLAKSAGVKSIEVKGNYAIISRHSKTIRMEISGSDKTLAQLKKKILEI